MLILPFSVGLISVGSRPLTAVPKFLASINILGFCSFPQIFVPFGFNTSTWQKNEHVQMCIVSNFIHHILFGIISFWKNAQEEIFTLYLQSGLGLYIYMYSYEYICFYESFYIYSNSRVKKLAPEAFQRNNFHYFMMPYISVSFSLFLDGLPCSLKLPGNNNPDFLLVIFSDASHST